MQIISFRTPVSRPLEISSHMPSSLHRGRGIASACITGAGRLNTRGGLGLRGLLTRLGGVRVLQDGVQLVHPRQPLLQFLQGSLTSNW